MKTPVYHLLACSLALTLAWSALSTTTSAHAADLESFTPEPGKALVVFTRSSSLGAAIKASVFDASTEQHQVIGILRTKRYLEYQTDPGDKLFMIIGESADFMRARLEAGKVYFANAQVRMGAWKARFSLIPYSAEDMQGEKFAKAVKAAKPVKAKPDASAWANKHAASIEKKRTKFYAKWQGKSEADKELRTLKHAFSGG